MLIAIEGIDGAGTTTQAQNLVHWLEQQGFAASFTREPSDGPIGALLRRTLRKELSMTPATLALLFAADRLDHLEREILPLSTRGGIVVSDRYVYSSLAYQALELPLDWVVSLNARAPQPDLTVFLRVDPQVAETRRRARSSVTELFESDDLQVRVAAQYEAIFADPRLCPSTLVALDGELPRDQVALAVQRAVTGRLPPNR